MQTQEEDSTAAVCARLLLDTIPPLMRLLGSMARQQTYGGDEAPTIGQIRLLQILGMRPWNLRDLALRTHVADSTMSRMIDSLVRRGWVERGDDPHDRRQLQLVLTDEGHAVHTMLAAQSHRAATELMDHLSPDDLLRLYDGLIVLQRFVTTQPGCTTEPQ